MANPGYFADKICHYCKEKGHFKNDCPKLARKQPSGKKCEYPAGAPHRQDILLINVGKIPRTRRIDLKIGYLVSKQIQAKQVQPKYSFKYNTR